MGLAQYDSRRYRTLVAITIPAGTLALPQPDGSLKIVDPLLPELHAVVSSGAVELEAQGLIRQLADGEA